MTKSRPTFCLEVAPGRWGEPVPMSGVTGTYDSAFDLISNMMCVISWGGVYRASNFSEATTAAGRWRILKMATFRETLYVIKENVWPNDDPRYGEWGPEQLDRRQRCALTLRRRVPISAERASMLDKTSAMSIKQCTTPHKLITALTW